MIVYFSGTGNSRAVAQRLGERLDKPCIPVTEHPDLSQCPQVIWVTPVYSWGLPPVVARAIADASLAPGSTHYLVATHGDDLGNTHRQWRSLIEGKGTTGAAAFSVEMPNTYVSLPFFDVDSPEVESRKLAAMPERVDKIAALIAAGHTGDDVVRGAFPWIKSALIYPVFISHAISDNAFEVDKTTCIKCGKCRQSCPVGNISSPDGFPVWLHHCAGCLGCYHICPVHAINRGRATRKKGQYYYHD